MYIEYFRRAVYFGIVAVAVVVIIDVAVSVADKVLLLLLLLSLWFAVFMGPSYWAMGICGKN